VRTVLAVDDDPDCSALLEATLQLGGYRVEVASSAEEALEILRSTRVDLVLIDVAMPEKDGWWLLRELRDDPSLAMLPAIMVSALRGVEHRLRGGVEGAVAYITKPYRPERLLEFVGEVLNEDSDHDGALITPPPA
jgi:DNA-binding response OmpR family regulator